MTMLKQMFVSLVQEEEGQGMVEYGLILALISIVAIATMTTLGQRVDTKLNAAATALQ